MLGVLRIPSIEWCKFKIVRELNVHFGHTENIQCREGDVPQSELTTNSVEDAVGAVSDKYGTGAGAYEDSTVFAIINLYLDRERDRVVRKRERNRRIHNLVHNYNSKHEIMHKFIIPSIQLYIFFLYISLF